MKLGPWDATYRSPLITSMPTRFAKGAVCERPVHGVDLVSTFFALAGISEPWSMHGQSLLPLLENPHIALPMHPLIYEHTGHFFGAGVGKTLREDPMHPEHNHVPFYVALNDGGWKYIRYLRASHGEELYDLQYDLGELVNLVTNQDHTEKLIRLRSAMKSELHRTGADFADTISEQN